MDFTLEEHTKDAADLAQNIAKDNSTAQRLTDVEKDTDERFDEKLFALLADAGLLGLAVSEENGGAGLSLVDAGVVAERLGRFVSPIPIDSHVAALTVIDQFGSDELISQWLAEGLDGSAVVAVAVAEDHDALPAEPTVTATRNGDQWVVNGTKTRVVTGTFARGFLISATTDDGVNLFAVDVDTDGVQIESQQVANHDHTAHLTLTNVTVDASRALGAEAALAVVERFAVLACAYQAGVVTGANRMTAKYAAEREQFGKKIGEFQAVAQRLADSYIDAKGLKLMTYQALWRISQDEPAEKELRSAMMWAADAGHRVAHSTVHVHGGVGIDLDAEPHRFFTAAKRGEFVFGGTTAQQRALGQLLAS